MFWSSFASLSFFLTECNGGGDVSVSESLSAGNIWIGQVVRSDGLYIVVHYFLLSSTYFTDDGASRILTDFATELSLEKVHSTIFFHQVHKSCFIRQQDTLS